MLKDRYILIVEDDITSQFLLENFLSDYNYSLIIAESGNKAIEKVKELQEKIELILMDVELPELDGYDATKEIKKINPKIPIIMQTAHALLEEKEIAIKSGCNDFVSKPIIKNELIPIVEKYISK